MPYWGIFGSPVALGGGPTFRAQDPGAFGRVMTDDHNLQKAQTLDYPNYVASPLNRLMSGEILDLC